MASFDAYELLSACLHLSAFAGAVIRDVVRSGQDLDMVNKADGAIVHFDPQTVADRRAQQRIVESLRAHFGSTLQIVGEEGVLEPPMPEDVMTPDTTLVAGSYAALAAADLIVWIDPLDGTRKFTEQAYDQVSVLIGLSHKGRPLVGVMHLPFVGSLGTTYYGGPLVHDVLVCPLLSLDATQWQFASVPRPSMPPHVQRWGISETRCAYIDALLAPGEASGTHGRWEKGATGILILDVVLGRCVAYARWIPRTKKWDICVGEAFLTAWGGHVTNIFGTPYDYVFDDAMHGNAHGVLATLDAAFFKETTSAAIALRNMSMST
ncbi:hypothetical protein SDRG_14564 [Saprolegnia diclina VS20]|uniref:Inositol monophosphatase n=1 Tax=Saprolegnia diclina (strain VS20) TaxID=1156394 RepID=T0PZG8_SAPDV|nr:hypothetical protein SDRG_14564 [Saprolegnia diclina VS20]EQC27656.1 hypothetical protein SDRG_14564 [Saprolegnia diclina VS20]|eukprot:XP_008618924.1 hypothetical protein SDRG_14564 [Saprolegnia diclina VS20]